MLLRYLPVLLLVLLSLVSSAQGERDFSEDDNLGVEDFDASYRGSESMRAGFYNLENLFDIYNDSTKNDDDFTPDGNYHWNYYKYTDKLSKLARVITAMGGWEPLEVLGVCEAENRKVLIDLIEETPLSSTNYQIIHEESPDNRGIDVAFLYNSDKINVVKHEAVPVEFSDPDSRPTRDILYVKARFRKNTIHFFVNHWPSRYGGQMVTVPKRNRAADVLKARTNEILKEEPDANIVIMGDFNDYPDDESLMKHLRARPDTNGMKDTSLVNLMYPKMGSEGTHKYQGKWGILDQFIVSGSLLRGRNGLQTSSEHALIFKADFLLEADPTHVGKRLHRTYSGYKYSGGYTDHLPIILDLHTLQRRTTR